MTNVAAARSAAESLRVHAQQLRHTEAVSECPHCNARFLAEWVLDVLDALGPEAIEPAPPGPVDPPRRPKLSQWTDHPSPETRDGQVETRESRSPDGDGLGCGDAGSNPARHRIVQRLQNTTQDAVNDAPGLANGAAPERRAGSEPADSHQATSARPRTGPADVSSGPQAKTQLIEDRNHALARQVALETRIAELETAHASLVQEMEMWRDEANQRMQLALLPPRDEPVNHLWAKAEYSTLNRVLALLRRSPAPEKRDVDGASTEVNYERPTQNR